MTQATLLDGILIIGGTVAFWRWVAKPLLAWSDFRSFRGVRVVPKDPEPERVPGVFVKHWEDE